MTDQRTSKRTAVVIGGSKGIGRGVANAWAAQGIETHVFSRSKPTGAGAQDLYWHSLDLRDREAADQMLTSIIPKQVDFVCYSAIYFTSKREPFSEVQENDWLDQFTINVHGLAMALRRTLPRMRESAPGVFLHISSEVVYNAGPFRSGYAATKAAADSLIRSISQEVDPSKVRFIQALPEGMVDTPGIRARRTPDFDYSEYMSPDSFGRIAVEIARTRGERFVGKALVVHGDSSWSEVAEGLPLSQSQLQSSSTTHGHNS